MSEDQLLKDALAYLAERADSKALSEELIPLEECVNETYVDGDFEEFRALNESIERKDV